jgi:16S rRNA (uracil1498-N3)-methyltransferase
MYNFFVSEDCRQANTFTIEGADYNHIKNVLRMQVGDTFLVSCQGVSHLCRIMDFQNETVQTEIVEENYQNTELPVKFYLFQGLPKSDKMEWIIQKCVELGVTQIVPVEMSRCVVKLEEKKKKSKQSRWQAIAESAAKQSKRTLIPEIAMPVSFKNALETAKEMNLLLVPYENHRGMIATKEALDLMKKGDSVGIFIGPEGGFDPWEVDALTAMGGKAVSLGNRILRTETAAITAMGMCMLHVEMKGEWE